MDENLPAETPPIEPVVVRYTTDGSDPSTSLPVEPTSSWSEEIVDAALAAKPEAPRQLGFRTAEEAPDDGAWPNLPVGGKFLPVRQRQHVRNPARNLRKELGKFLGKVLSGRQWVKARKEYLRHVAEREGISRTTMKQRERNPGTVPAPVAAPEPTPET